MNENGRIEEAKDILLDQIRYLNKRSKKEGISEKDLCNLAREIGYLAAEYRYWVDSN